MTSSAVPDPAARRRRLANSFGQAADSYDRFRAHYPADAVAATVDGAHRVLELGAGAADELHGLADTYSYVLTAAPSSREALHRQLDELIGIRPDVAIAERCQVWTAVRM